MEFFNRLTTSVDQSQAVADLLQGAQGAYDLGVLYVCPQKPYDATGIYEELRQRLCVRHFLCCTCAGIIGSMQEVESRPSASLMLARLPGVAITPFFLDQPGLEGLAMPEDWYEMLEVYPTEKPGFLVLADPFSIEVNRVLAGLNRAYPGAVVMGGLASAAMEPLGNMLLLNGQSFQEGMIGVCLKGNLCIEAVVSQGCRPIGESYIITRSDRNIIHELAGRPFAKVLEEVLKKASEFDRQLARQAVLIGIATNEYRDEFKRGDFLVRSVLSIDPSNGAGMVGDRVANGQSVQFHVRDAKTASEDLHGLLRQYAARPRSVAPHGAFVFSCNGRGVGLFGQKDHDIRVIQQYLGPIPAAGFFCAGEIGPVAGTNFLHGFTNSLALFYPER